MTLLPGILHNRSLRFWALGVLGVAVLALGLAYLSQYGFGLRPCEMCYWQRIPFAVLLVLAPLACFCPKLAPALLKLSVLVLLVSAGLGAFHAGVEWQWWEGPSACSGGFRADMTPAEILAQIQQAAVVNCKEAAIRVLGLSMAGWNALYSLGCALLLAIGLKTARS